MGETRGQHYLPQFLLRGFASRRKEKKAWTYRFSKDAAGREVSVRDIGKETDFHGKPRYSDLEEKMQAVETVFAPHVARWREGRFFAETDEEMASRFVGHLIIRTKNLREAFSEGSQVVFDELCRRLNTGELNPLSHPDAEAEIVRRVSANPMLRAMARQKPREFRARVRVLISETERKGKVLKWAQEVAHQMRTFDVREAAAKAHIKSLTTHQVPETGVQILRGLAWSVVHTERQLILGDAGAVALEIDTTQLKHPKAFDFNRVGLICCPIASNCALLARAASCSHPFSVEEMNQASAELSQEFFVAAERNVNFDELQKRIGIRAGILSPEEIRGCIPTEMPPVQQN